MKKIYDTDTHKGWVVEGTEKEKPALVDATAMTAAEFRKVVLELLGIKCK